jgi:hypothetical protein
MINDLHKDDNKFNNNNNNNNVKLDNKHWYEHVPKSAKWSHESKVTMLWNQQVQTKRTILNNKPKIIIHGNKQGTCMLIDVEIPADINVIRKEDEKVLKHQDLITETQHM